MYEKFKTWIKEFFHNPISVILLVLFVALFAWTVLGSNLSGNGNTVDTVREQLDRIETTKSDIEGTAGAIESSTGKLEEGINGAENSINTAQETSSGFDAVIGECESILEQIRNQPAK